MACDTAHAQALHARGGELDGQRYAIEGPANAGDHRKLCLGRIERVDAGADPLDEKLERRVALRRGCIDLGHRRRHFEGADALHPFALNAQRLPAGGQQVHARGGRQQLLGQLRNRVDEVLAVVDDDQHALVAQEGADAADGVRGERRDAERGGKRVGHEARVFEGCEADEEHLMLEGGRKPVGHGKCHGRLADAPRADEGHAAAGRQLAHEVAHEFVAPHHARQQDG